MDETTAEENTRELTSDLERPESHVQCPDLPLLPSLTRYESIWSDFISVDVIPVLSSGLEHLSYVDEARRLFVEKNFDSQLLEYLEKRWTHCRSDQVINYYPWLFCFQSVIFDFRRHLSSGSLADCRSQGSNCRQKGGGVNQVKDLTVWVHILTKIE